MPEPALRLAAGLALPLDLATQAIAILAQRGAGKTYAAAVLVEEFHGAGMPTVVVDPVGVWWGLRSSADGASPGLPVVILGGDHADIPLEPTAGAVVADFLVEARQPAVLDLSAFRKGESVRFMTDFAETLYRKNRAPLHLVLDEADAFAAQRPQRGEERLLGAIEDIVRRGRARGLGCTLITQRAAVLNKNADARGTCAASHYRCDDPRVEGSRYCAKHKAERVGRARGRNADLKAAGLCGICRKPIGARSSTYCDAHQAAETERSRIRYQRRRFRALARTRLAGK